MDQHGEIYIDGRWQAPHGTRRVDVIDPSTERVRGTLTLGDSHDVDRAVAAARRAFADYARSGVPERAALLERVIGEYRSRLNDLAEAVSTDMGAPLSLSRVAQAPSGLRHLQHTLEAMRSFAWEEDAGRNRVVHEPIGVCALITPWNWPLNEIATKVAPALGAGCTMVLKPSELAPASARVFAEVLHSAGVPPGVFNMVHGTGLEVGAALSAHADVDMVSFTGSTRAGVHVAQNAAPSVKRVVQELGGKSATLLLDDADFSKAVLHGLNGCTLNSGQSCMAPTRMLVPKARMAEAAALARRAALALKVGPPRQPDASIGPLVSRAQWERVQAYLRSGVAQGAVLECGGEGLPEHLHEGYFVKPTVFSHVTNDMTIAREEIFGPVLCLLGFDDDDDAVRIANDSPYGLCGYVHSADLERARRVARQLRAGTIHVNGAITDYACPFGGYKQSGNGRKYAAWGLREYLEPKAILGYAAS